MACDTGSSESPLSDYRPRFAHQAYGHSLAQARLTQTALGRDWLAAAETALLEPELIELPYALEGRFDAAVPEALGLRFRADPARRLVVTLRFEENAALEAFVDLFRVAGRGLEHVASAPPAAVDGGPRPVREIELEVFEPTDYVLRVQPELLRGASFALSVDSSPVLAFPVSGYDSRAIQSGFGAERDGGRRAHRGVDIFANRGTEALAAIDGWVARVDTTPRGGNVVWLQPLFGNMRLYYAHLDTQLVTTGQFVKAGDVVGTVGNTGNAITTPPHLHFGVYLRRAGRRGGARDPYEFLY